MHFLGVVPLPTTVQTNEDETSTPKNCDKRPNLMEKNSISGVYEVILCFFYYDDCFLLALWKRLDVYLCG